MDQSVAWMIVVGLSSSWLIFFTCFLLIMKKSYLSTFFSLQTGHAWVKASFLNGTDDQQKTRVLRKNRKQWASIRGDVKAWTLENWERWEEEKPAFFNDAFKASVDDDMIPAASLRKLRGAGSSRRRSSLGEAMGLVVVKEAADEETVEDVDVAEEEPVDAANKDTTTNFPPTCYKGKLLFDRALAITTRRRFELETHSQDLSEFAVQQSSLRIHAGVSEVANVLLNHLKPAYESKLDTVKLDDAVEAVGLGEGFASASEKPEEVMGAAPLAAALPGAVNDDDDDNEDEVKESDDGGGKKPVEAQLREEEPVPLLHAATASFTRSVLHVSSEPFAFELSLNPLLPSSASSVSIEFRPTLSTSFLPHAASGTFVISPASHGTCTLTMAATVKCVGLDAAPPPTGAATATTELLPRANAELPLDRKHAHDLLDDLLSLLPALSAHFDRSDEIDEKICGELARHFETTSVQISDHENKLIDATLENEDKVRARPKSYSPPTPRL